MKQTLHLKNKHIEHVGHVESSGVLNNKPSNKYKTKVDLYNLNDSKVTFKHLTINQELYGILNTLSKRIYEVCNNHYIGHKSDIYLDFEDLIKANIPNNLSKLCKDNNLKINKLISKLKSFHMFNLLICFNIFKNSFNNNENTIIKKYSYTCIGNINDSFKLKCLSYSILNILLVLSLNRKLKSIIKKNNTNKDINSIRDKISWHIKCTEIHLNFLFSKNYNDKFNTN